MLFEVKRIVNIEFDIKPILFSYMPFFCSLTATGSTGKISSPRQLVSEMISNEAGSEYTVTE